MTVVLIVLVALLAAFAVLWIRGTVALNRTSQELAARKASHPYSATDVAAARRESVGRSRAVTNGQVWETVAPLLPDFAERFNLKDAHFLGQPVDYVVFDGLDEDRPEVHVVFLEVKTGNSALSTRQRRIRDAVRAGRVEWLELRFGGIDGEPVDQPPVEIDWSTITAVFLDAESSAGIVWEDDAD